MGETLYNCDGIDELVACRAIGTELVDTGDLTFNSEYDDMLEWNGFNVYTLSIDGNTAEIFIP